MSERNDMTCAELADVAAELALGVLTGRERGAALAHLETCEDCREEVRLLMATGEQFLELLPPAEPPAGFETRVLDRLGLSAPPVRGHAELLQPGKRDLQPRRRSRHRATVRPGHRVRSDDGTRPSGAVRPRRPGRLRRALAATVMGLALIGAGLGGWRIGAGSPAIGTAAGPLTSAKLLSATHQDVGDIFLYSGANRWLYMSVDLGSGDESVTCQVIGPNGELTTVGSFRLAGGYGGWGSPEPNNADTVRGAQLVASDGTVLASATFTR
jgi:hypothetical protein